MKIRRLENMMSCRDGVTIDQLIRELQSRRMQLGGETKVMIAVQPVDAPLVASLQYPALILEADWGETPALEEPIIVISP